MTTDKASILKIIFVTPQPMRTALFVQPHYCALATYHEGFDKFVDFDSYQSLKAENERLRESLQWALNGDTGLSSKHLVATHFNMDAEFYSPCDKGDRRRCIGAIRAISGLEDTLDIMKNKVKWAEQVPLIIEEMKG